jgi:Tfp pilus assembly protein PilF
MGAIWARKGELDKAAALWQRSLSLDPDFLPARMKLALILEKSDPALAAKHWEIFLQRAAAQGQPVNQAFVRKRIAELNEKIRK